MRPRSTRAQLLDRIVDAGGATAAAVGGELGIATATARRHLDRLEADGMLEVDVVRHGPGRPSHVYRATELGVRAARDRSWSLAGRVFGELERLDAAGPRISEALANNVADAHRSEVGDGTIEERVEEVVGALRPEGIVDGWKRAKETLILINNACPYLSAATASDCVCEADRLAIEKLLGVEVVQTGRVAGGDERCEYVVPLHAAAANC